MRLLKRIRPRVRALVKEGRAEEKPGGRAPATPRRRALTSPSESVNQQLQSPFFRLLPPELRNRVYELVLADGGSHEGRELHLASMPGRLGCIRCFENGPGVRAGRDHDCWGWCYPDGTHRGPYEGQPQRTSLLSVLLLCSRSYIESVGILYSENKFAVRQLKTLVELRRAIPTQRLHSIRFLCIEIELHFPVTLTRVDDEETYLTWSSRTRWPDDRGIMWLSACRVVTSMRGLRELHITVRDCAALWRKPGAEITYAQFLGPLLDVHSSTFHVRIYGAYDVELVLSNFSKAPPFTLSAGKPEEDAEG